MTRIFFFWYIWATYIKFNNYNFCNVSVISAMVFALEISVELEKIQINFCMKMKRLRLQFIVTLWSQCRVSVNFYMHYSYSDTLFSTRNVIKIKSVETQFIYWFKLYKSRTIYWSFTDKYRSFNKQYSL